MAFIQARRDKKGKIKSYRLVVSEGLNWKGQQRRRYSSWKPTNPNMSEKQMEKAALAAAFKFEEELKAGYETNKRHKFHTYAEYVIDLKARTGLSPTTIERYRSMLPRINDAIGHLKITEIRAHHLNDFYKQLSENGVRNKGAIATAKKVVKKKVEALQMPLLCLFLRFPNNFYTILIFSDVIRIDQNLHRKGFPVFHRGLE